MARSRNIKHSFFLNDELSEVEPLGRLLFIGLWTVADYQGRLEYRPKKLKAELMPYDDCDIECIVNNLNKSGFIATYSVQGKQYIEITNFTKHQNPHKNERDKGSSIPSPELSDAKKVPQPIESKGIAINTDKISNAPDNDASDRADSCFLIPDSLSLIPEENTGDCEIAEIDIAEKFNEFWKGLDQWHGKKGNKQEALREFKKINPDEDLVSQMILGYQAQVQYSNKLKSLNQFAEQFKHVCRWLKWRSWEDEVPSLESVVSIQNSNGVISHANSNPNLNAAQRRAERFRQRQSEGAGEREIAGFVVEQGQDSDFV